MQSMPARTLTATAFWPPAFAQSAEPAKRPIDGTSEEACWQQFALGYDHKSPLAPCVTESVRDPQAPIGPGSEMLEINAGPGAFTRRMADHLSQITIVEPSTAMRAECAWPWQGPQTDKTLTCKWKEALAFKADLVFGANAFHRIEDIAAALLKMNACSRQRVALVQTIGRPLAAPLCANFGQTYERERADALCDVLTERNIPPSAGRRHPTPQRPKPDRAHRLGACVRLALHRTPRILDLSARPRKSARGGSGVAPLRPG